MSQKDAAELVIVYMRSMVQDLFRGIPLRETCLKGGYFKPVPVLDSPSKA